MNKFEITNLLKELGYIYTPSEANKINYALLNYRLINHDQLVEQLKTRFSEQPNFKILIDTIQGILKKEEPIKRATGCKKCHYTGWVDVFNYKTVCQTNMDLNKLNDMPVFMLPKMLVRCPDCFDSSQFNQCQAEVQMMPGIYATLFNKLWDSFLNDYAIKPTQPTFNLN